MVINSKKDLITWASLKNINVYIDQKQVLSNININLKYGENIVILGPNGSGKSTFLKLFNRSIYPKVSKDSSIKIFNSSNINIFELRRRVGFLFKEMEERIIRGVNLYDVIASGFSGSFNTKNKDSLSKTEKIKLENLINDWQLNDIIYNDFYSLSDGQKRRALIARAIVYEPNLIVLDEPFCNLDLKSHFILNKNLNKLINKSVNIIYITHTLESILPETNRVILIKDGMIIKEGSPKNIINSKTISDLFNISIKVVKEDKYWRGLPEIVKEE